MITTPEARVITREEAQRELDKSTTVEDKEAWRRFMQQMAVRENRDPHLTILRLESALQQSRNHVTRLQTDLAAEVAKREGIEKRYADLRRDVARGVILR